MLCFWRVDREFCLALRVTPSNGLARLVPAYWGGRHEDGGRASDAQGCRLHDGWLLLLFSLLVTTCRS